MTCDPIDWFKELDLGTLTPRGATVPVAVKLPPIGARCLSVATRSPLLPEGSAQPK